MACEYEKLRLKNLEDNKRILAELGLMNPFAPKRVQLQKKAVKRKAPAKETPKPKPAVLLAVGEAYASDEGTPHKRRRSNRLKGQTPEQQAEEPVDEPDEEEAPRLKAPPNRPNFYGEVPGVSIGTLWDTRLECCIAGIHRPTVAGIHAGPEGAYSIALSGGYDDNVDLGECFTYTGEGGRDLKGTKANPKNLRTAPQSKDQTLSRGNLALTKNVETGQPVRVIRGYKLPTQYAPEEGYRYDGLYKVEKHWYTTGVSGFGVFKFALKRLENQAPPPWTYLEEGSQNDDYKPQEEASTEQAPSNLVDAKKKSTVISDDDETKDTSSSDKTTESTVDTAKPEVTDGSQDSGFSSQATVNTDGEVDRAREYDIDMSHKDETDLKNDLEDASPQIIRKLEGESQDSGMDDGSQKATLEKDEKSPTEGNENVIDNVPDKREEDVTREEGSVKCEASAKYGKENEENLKDITDLKINPEDLPQTNKKQKEEERQDSGMDVMANEATAQRDDNPPLEDDENVSARDIVLHKSENEDDEAQEKNKLKCTLVEKCERENKENLKSKENLIKETSQEDENCNVPKQRDIPVDTVSQL